MTATTELEAVNIMLAAIGEAPINSLTGTVPVDVRLAQSTLNEVNKEVQSEGWSFNTEINVELSRDGDDQVALSSNVLRVDPNVYDHADIDAIQIGLKLYDRKNHRYTFTEDLKCTVVYFRTFDEIPEPAKRYVNVKAARRARSILMETDLSNADHNLLRGDPALTDVFSTYSPSNVLIR